MAAIHGAVSLLLVLFALVVQEATYTPRLAIAGTLCALPASDDAHLACPEVHALLVALFGLTVCRFLTVPHVLAVGL